LVGCSGVVEVVASGDSDHGLPSPEELLRRANACPPRLQTYKTSSRFALLALLFFFPKVYKTS
jgi:hypothetical protein